MWKHSALQPKDAIHVATALLRKVVKLHTFDDELLKLSNKYGKPRLKICKPDIAYQMELDEYKPSKKDDTGKTQQTP